jgi:hypothetical protein
MRLEGNVIARSGEIMAKIDFRNKINWRRRYRSPQGVETEREILRISKAIADASSTRRRSAAAAKTRFSRWSAMPRCVRG